MSPFSGSSPFFFFFFESKTDPLQMLFIATARYPTNIQNVTICIMLEVYTTAQAMCIWVWFPSQYSKTIYE